MTRYRGDRETDEEFSDVSNYDPHIYDGERCIRCNTNVYDEMVYGATECIRTYRDEPVVYSTQTGDESVFDSAARGEEI